MKIAVIGAGAIGSVVAAYLAKAGKDVTLVGKSEQVEQIRRAGLKITGTRGEETVKLKVAPKLDQAYDLVIMTTKTQDLEAAYQENCDYLEEGFVLTTQNGVQADTILGIHVDRERLFSSIVMFGSTYTHPGEVVFNFEGDWILGKPYNPIGPSTQEIADELKSAFSVVVAENIMGMKYLKLFVNFNNCLPALIGRSMQETFADMDFCRLSILLLKEGVDIIQKAHIDLVSLPQFPVERVHSLVAMPIEQASGIINKTLTGLSREPLYGSILQSILRKRSSEIDFINGEVVHLAKQMRQEAPLNEKIVELVHQVERTNQFFTPEQVKDIFDIKMKEASK